MHPGIVYGLCVKFDLSAVAGNRFVAEVEPTACGDASPANVPAGYLHLFYKYAQGAGNGMIFAKCKTLVLVDDGRR